MSRTFLVLLALLVWAGSPSGAAAAEGERSLSVGVVVPLTGTMSFQGIAIRNSIMLALEDWDVKRRLKVTFEDDGWQVKNTISAVQKLRSEQQIRFLIVFGANQSAAVAEIAERESLPFVSISVLPAVVEDRKFVTLFMPSVRLLTAKTIAAVRHRGYKTAAVIASIQDATLLQREMFSESGAARVVLTEERIPGDTDLRSLGTRIAALNPDAVFLSLLPPQGSTLARQLRVLGYRGSLFGGIQLANRDEITAAQGALTGAWVVAGDDRGAGGYYERYEKRFGQACTAEAIYGYDAMKMLLESVEKGVPPNEYFHTVQGFSGVLGTYGSDGKNSFTFGVVAKEIAGDGFRYLAE